VEFAKQQAVVVSLEEWGLIVKLSPKTW